MTKLERRRAEAVALQRTHDVNLWRAARPGQDETLDADRFVRWLEDLIDREDAGSAVDTLTQVDEALLAALCAAHVRVFDLAAVDSFAGGSGAEIGGYLLEPRRPETWETIASVLQALATDRPDPFHRLMQGIRALSNSKPELDGLDALLTTDDQHLLDLAIERQVRREHEGYATTADARAFLQASRELRPGGTLPATGHAIADAYFRTMGVRRVSVPPERLSRQRARALPVRPDGAPRYARLHAFMTLVRDVDEAAYLSLSSELGFLANMLAAGARVQATALTPAQAAEAAAGICNLGLESWPADWPLSSDLVTAFQVGWTTLHREACLATAERLISAAADATPQDVEIRVGLRHMERELTRHWRAGVPWRARGAFEVLLLIDQTVWAAVSTLIDECPVMHAAAAARLDQAPGCVDADAWEFITDRRGLDAARAFGARLPALLAT
jgi:hypothetical protein